MADLAVGLLAPLAFSISAFLCFPQHLDWVAPLNGVAIAADTQLLASITGVPTFQGLCGSDLNTNSKWA